MCICSKKKGSATTRNASAMNKVDVKSGPPSKPTSAVTPTTSKEPTDKATVPVVKENKPATAPESPPQKTPTSTPEKTKTPQDTSKPRQRTSCASTEVKLPRAPFGEQKDKLAQIEQCLLEDTEDPEGSTKNLKKQ